MGKKGFERLAAPGTTAARVEELFGPPDEKYPDGKSWVDMLAKGPACLPTERIKSAWRYSPAAYDDAMVFFDTAGRVVCVHEGGMIFDEAHF